MVSFNARRRVVQVADVSEIGGLLLLAKKNVYIIDGFFQTSTGELVDAADAPPEVSDLFSSAVEAYC